MYNSNSEENKDYLGEYMAECPRCHHRYNKSLHGNKCPDCGYKKKTALLPWIIVIIFLILCILCLDISNSLYKENTNVAANNQANKNNYINNNYELVEEIIKENTFFKCPIENCVAPLKIDTPSEYDYYIYIKCMEDSSNDIALYQKGGSTISINVPLGNYEFYYCSGLNWYGINDKFGPNTKYTKSQDIINFYIDGLTVYGHTISLYKSTDGNMKSIPINSADFPD